MDKPTLIILSLIAKSLKPLDIRGIIHFIDKQYWDDFEDCRQSCCIEDSLTNLLAEGYLTYQQGLPDNVFPGYEATELGRNYIL